MQQSNRSEGFTLIELLIVMGLIVTLMALLFAAGIKYKTKASIEATRSLVQRLELNIQEYHSLMGVYPSDGLDDDVVETRDMGNTLKSAAALAYALVEPLTIKSFGPGGQEIETEQEEGLVSFKGDEIIRPDEDDPQMCELVDAFGEGLHYDNLQGGYSPQDSEDVHLAEVSYHGDDPREEEGLVEEVGPQNGRKFDIWSHGARGHTESEKLSDFIGNFTNRAEGNDSDYDDGGEEE